MRLAWAPVTHTRSVVPHATEVDDAAADLCDASVHRAVRVSVRAIQEFDRRVAALAGPPSADLCEVAVDAAGRNQHCIAFNLERLARRLVHAGATADAAVDVVQTF